MNEHTIANITASAMGTNRKRATPSRKNIGTNTMQMHSSDTNAGVDDLRGAVQDRGLDVLALLEMPVDVLDRHGRVVDEDADREREAAERHDVERLAERATSSAIAPSTDSGIEIAMITRRAPAAEEQQDHDAGQRRRDDAFERDALDRRAHEQRLVVDRRDLEIVRQRRLDLGELLLDAGDDVERRGRAVLQDRHQHRARAVDVDDVGLRRVAVAHVRDVADIDRRAVDDLDRQVAEIVDRARRVVELHRVFELADLLRADRRDQVLRGERVARRPAPRARAPASAFGSMSICTWRDLPPNGYGIAAPGTVTSRVRTDVEAEIGERSARTALCRTARAAGSAPSMRCS